MGLDRQRESKSCVHACPKPGTGGLMAVPCLSAGLPHPILLWGNGLAAPVALYTSLLEHWASHGFVVGAANTTNAGNGQEMLACLDWLASEQDRVGGPYEGHLDLHAKHFD
jgi:hypothetical protein